MVCLTLPGLASSRDSSRCKEICMMKSEAEESAESRGRWPERLAMAQS